MADFAGPSFSLGLDLDVDPDLSSEEEEDGDQRAPHEGPERGRSPLPEASSSGHRSYLREGEDEEEGDYPMEALAEVAPASTPALKRLKRGPPPSRSPGAGPSTPGDAVQFSAWDDDIEEFSSQEDRAVGDESCSRHIHTACSSSKCSLHGQRILATLSGRKLKAPKNTPNSKVSISTSVEASSNKKVFLRLTTSPLKRIQLLDSDSDDLSVCKDGKGADAACPKTNSFASTQCFSKSQRKMPEKASVKLQSDNLWKDFGPKTNSNLATPALNEFCEEYFKSVKTPNVGQWSEQRTAVTSSDVPPDEFVGGAACHPQNSCTTNRAEHYCNLPDLQPPSYEYFYHHDVRIQKLVRLRLPNFAPLGDVRHMGSQQRSAETLDYLGQFGQRKAPCPVLGVGEKAQEGNSKGRPRNQKNAKGKEVAGASGPWVTPKSSNAIPKDAGKRRVHADGHSSGYWFTGQDGRRVYVTEDRQQLSGRIAYRHYMKESGAGFRSRKKAAGASKKKAKK